MRGTVHGLDIRPGDSVRLKYTGDAPINRMDDGRWAAVVRVCRVRVVVSLDNHVLHIHPVNISKVSHG